MEVKNEKKLVFLVVIMIIILFAACNKTTETKDKAEQQETIDLKTITEDEKNKAINLLNSLDSVSNISEGGIDGEVMGKLLFEYKITYKKVDKSVLMVTVSGVWAEPDGHLEYVYHGLKEDLGAIKFKQMVGMYLNNCSYTFKVDLDSNSVNLDSTGVY